MLHVPGHVVDVGHHVPGHLRPQGVTIEVEGHVGRRCAHGDTQNLKQKYGCIQAHLPDLSSQGQQLFNKIF